MTSVPPASRMTRSASRVGLGEPGLRRFEADRTGVLEEAALVEERHDERRGPAGRTSANRPGPVASQAQHEGDVVARREDDVPRALAHRARSSQLTNRSTSHTGGHCRRRVTCRDQSAGPDPGRVGNRDGDAIAAQRARRGERAVVPSVAHQDWNALGNGQGEAHYHLFAADFAQVAPFRSCIEPSANVAINFSLNVTHAWDMFRRPRYRPPAAGASQPPPCTVFRRACPPRPPPETLPDALGAADPVRAVADISRRAAAGSKPPGNRSRRSGRDAVPGRNSTEDFLDSVCPAILGLLALRLLDVVRPWVFTGVKPRGTCWRVRLLVLLFPWTLLVWRRRARALARQYPNRPLVRALAERDGPWAIVTVGFGFIVRPLVAALGIAPRTIVASRLSSARDRREGKLAITLAALGEGSVSESLVITDSVQDFPLLERCACPLRVVWPEARYVPAFSTTYLPGQYLSHVKRPGQRYILRGILQEDFAFWVLASVVFARVPAAHVTGLAFLLLSFWAIYERGYVDNDRVLAARFELEPRLSKAFHASPVARRHRSPALDLGTRGGCGRGVSAGLAQAVFDRPLLGVGGGARRDLPVVPSVQPLRQEHPRLDVSPAAGRPRRRVRGHRRRQPRWRPRSRSSYLSRWVHYYIYRLGHSSWPKAHTELMRVCFFVVLAALLALAEGGAVVMTWLGLAILAWNVFRARTQLLELCRGASRIDRRRRPLRRRRSVPNDDTPRAALQE